MPEHTFVPHPASASASAPVAAPASAPAAAPDIPPGALPPALRGWAAAVRPRGIVFCPSSSPLPVDVRGLLADGTGFHLRCRGTRVTLASYRPGRARWQVPLEGLAWVPEEYLSLWERRPLDDPGALAAAATQPAGARLVFGGAPDRGATYDGHRRHGWRGHEAGLLRPDAAARIFESLLADVVPAPAPAAASASASAQDSASAAAPAEAEVPGAVPGPRRPSRTGRRARPGRSDPPEGTLSSRPASEAVR
jgi:hypothetical protein